MISRFKNIVIKWLLSSSQLNSIIDEKVKNRLENELLHQWRVWGDESRLTLGVNVQLNNALINTVSGIVQIGDNSFLGHGVSLLTGTHDFRKVGIKRQTEVPHLGRDIIIGKGVWIASNATIIGPCNIGDNCVISANVVVSGVIERDTKVTLGCGVIKEIIKF